MKGGIWPVQRGALALQAASVDILCHPVTHEALVLESVNLLRGVSSADRFPIKQGIPILLPASDCIGENKKYQRLYDRIAIGYDIAESCYEWWNGLRIGDMRRELLKDVAIGPGSKVLEVSVGTGANLWILPEHAEYYGLDISWKMLERCQRNAKRKKRKVELVHGSAEHLPFRDASFDAVFHIGGINFFNDKGRAIQEMIRVARPGTRIVIADEEEQVVKTSYERNPLISWAFRGRKEPVSAPVGLVPREMRDLKVDSALEGKAYLLSFVKAETAEA
jgi:ubiquinone/menaquinone biosynthesis C-methylase UbiE